MQNVTNQNYSTRYPSSISSTTEKWDRSETFDKLLSFWAGQKSSNVPFYQTLLLYLFEIDPSSVMPRFEPKSITSWIEETTKEIAYEEMLEYQTVVHIPPKRRYNIELEITNIKKAEPKIVTPDLT
jgi:hypothetical protein